MNMELPETIRLRDAIRLDVGGKGSIVGSSEVDDQGRLLVGIGISDATGMRDIEGLSEGDTFEFAGATWRVARIFEPVVRPRELDVAGGGGSVADLVREPA